MFAFAMLRSLRSLMETWARSPEPAADGSAASEGATVEEADVPEGCAAVLRAVVIYFNCTAW